MLRSQTMRPRTRVPASQRLRLRARQLDDVTPTDDEQQLSAHYERQVRAPLSDDALKALVALAAADTSPTGV